jgi:hypothetical protein
MGNDKRVRRGDPPDGDIANYQTNGVAPGKATLTGGLPSRPVASEGAVSREEVMEIVERRSLIDRLTGITAVRFNAIRFALKRTCDALEVRKPKKTDLLMQLVGLAVAASIAGVAGVVAEHVALRMTKIKLPGFDRFPKAQQRFINDFVKDGFKKAFTLTLDTDGGDWKEELARTFETGQFLKIQAAERHFLATDPDVAMENFRDLTLDELRELVDQASRDNGDEELIELVARQVAAEWANLQARVHHGSGNWDPWAGPRGSKEAFATEGAIPPPDFDAIGGFGNDPSHGNVDSEGAHMKNLLDTDQRSMQPDLHGIIEVCLWADGVVNVNGHLLAQRFVLFKGYDLGLRLAGVSDHVKTLIRGSGHVRDAKMNKIVRIYSNDDLVPPKPRACLLITADGYVRQSTGDLEPSELVNAAEAAQALSLEHIQ